MSRKRGDGAMVEGAQLANYRDFGMAVGMMLDSIVPKDTYSWW
jgi:hypothetical protein